jgi:hypothetical protein
MLLDGQTYEWADRDATSTPSRVIIRADRDATSTPSRVIIRGDALFIFVTYVTMKINTKKKDRRKIKIVL